MYTHHNFDTSTPAVSRTRGVTLIELLVVLAIIGILSSVAMSSFTGAREKGRDTKRITAITEISLVLEMYYNKCGRQYPATLTSGAATGCTSPTTLGSLFNGSIPTDPQGGAFEYASPGLHYTYVVKAQLEQNNPVLNDDLDGTVSGVACADGPTGTPPRYFYCKGSL